MEDSHRRALGAFERDQYADTNAVLAMEYYAASKRERTSLYKDWMVGQLKRRGCQTVLDVACGTGVDSILLLEEGFDVVSTDGSEHMLKHALRKRWSRRKEPAFDKWVIEEANWLTLGDDLEGVEGVPVEGFDAILCMGNSFTHLPDYDGTQKDQKKAILEFKKMLKPGGVLLIDHRNYDVILHTGRPPHQNVYWEKNPLADIKWSSLFVDGRPTMVIHNYAMNVASILHDDDCPKKLKRNHPADVHHFQLSFYPVHLEDFRGLLQGCFDQKYKDYTLYGDFQPISQDRTPANYMHVIQLSE